MMNIVGTNAADAAVSSNVSTGKKGADKGEGFSDAMSEFDKDDVSSKPGAKQAADDSDVADQDTSASDEVAAKPKPIIDIRPESLRKPTIPAQSAFLQQEQKISAKEVLGKETTRELTAGEKKLKDALAAAKALTAKADALEGKDGAEAEDIDLDKLLSQDDSELELGDILSLLNGQGAVAAAEGMAPAQKVHVSGKQGKADGDAMRSKSDVSSAISALSSMSADTDATPVPGTEVKTEQDRLFRFQDAKGERQSMDMRVGDGRSERVDARSSAGGQAETVNVLDLAPLPWPRSERLRFDVGDVRRQRMGFCHAVDELFAERWRSEHHRWRRQYPEAADDAARPRFRDGHASPPWRAAQCPPDSGNTCCLPSAVG
ncbi:hypothetical protein N7E02_19000 [Aliirhizobium terrae]|uniref:hypothetical protein n=1 Tax=Terrirhizobium terrae TaxID=2926709 RepID=UPI002576EA55|nr:hypothetical protein [Rhizobium sp. CC-CFT758]WJH39000.1 hypothetical protein N7E02_19000 [Rhizobium sp. CC-CFT758]